MVATDRQAAMSAEKQMPDDVLRLSAGEIRRLPGVTPWVRAALMILTNVRWGQLLIVLPDGRRLCFEGPEGEECGILIVQDLRFAKRLLTGGGIGFAEAYLDGWWDSPDLGALITVIAHNNAAIGEQMRGKLWVRMLEGVRHNLLRRNSRRGARKNIHHHYDLGNAFYTEWLDETMTYSSAKFASDGEPLAQAQQNKYRALAQSMGLRPGSHVLEVGSGWGGFAEFAASEIDCRVTGITISAEQYEYARRRMFEKGLNEKVDIRLQDYRDVAEQYDNVASIEMFEAVGEQYWPVFFGKLRDRLAPGGTAGLQIITIADAQFDAYRKGSDFIQRYIFPGGMLPSVTALREQVARAGLQWRDAITFGHDYAETLLQWRQRFLARWPEISEQGFDERFRRLWIYYLAYCEGGFRSGNTDVTQICLARN